MFLRINQKEKIPIDKIPLLCYTIYYFSCIFTNSRIWLWNEKTEEGQTKKDIIKNKQTSRINIQKTIINTLLDLINSLIEANFEILDKETKIGEVKEKNFLYEFINNKFTQKLKINFIIGKNLLIGHDVLDIE